MEEEEEERLIQIQDKEEQSPRAIARSPLRTSCLGLVKEAAEAAEAAGKGSRPQAKHFITQSKNGQRETGIETKRERKKKSQPTLIIHKYLVPTYTY